MTYPKMGVILYTYPKQTQRRHKMTKYKIKSLRVLNGIKAGDFAKELGISREYLRLIENGKAKNPNVKLMKDIAKALNSDVQTLFFSDEE